MNNINAETGLLIALLGFVAIVGIGLLGMRALWRTNFSEKRGEDSLPPPR